MRPGWVPTVEAKLATMVGYVDELAQRLPSDEADYLGDRDRQLAVERLCHLVVECAIDSNALLLGGLGEPPPQSAREGFDNAERAGVLPPDVAQGFRATYVGLRNRLVHDYERVDNRIIYRTASRLVSAGRRYVASVTAYLPPTP